MFYQLFFCDKKVAKKSPASEKKLKIWFSSENEIVPTYSMALLQRTLVLTAGPGFSRWISFFYA